MDATSPYLNKPLRTLAEVYEARLQRLETKRAAQRNLPPSGPITARVEAATGIVSGEYDARYPIFRDHFCSRCGSGLKRACVQGNPNSCSWPHARND
jgi:hypothetical protein